MKSTEFLIESYEQHRQSIDTFIKWVYEKLHIQSPLPKLEFSDEKEGNDQKRTGWYNFETNTLWVYTGHRNLIDILRTVAHELAHHKQREEDETKHTAPLSQVESEADQAAGMLIKIYVRSHPEIIQ
jgi:hypothetical protein